MHIGAARLGGNSFRLVVADVSRPDRMVRLSEHHHALHLASSVARTGALCDDEIAGAAAIATQLVHEACQGGARRLALVATSVFRDASNGAEALLAVERAADVHVSLLTPTREAELSHRGAMWGFGGLGAFTSVDLGGGSLLISSSDGDGAIDTRLCLPLGTDRVHARLCSSDYVRRSERVRVDAHVTASLDAVTDALDSIAGRPVVLLGGAARALARVEMVRRWGQPPRTVHGERLTWGDLTRIIDCITGVSPATLARAASLPTERAAQLPVGAAILRQALRALDTRHAMVGETGMLEALLLDASTADDATQRGAGLQAA